jgi:hypothetical protein
VCIHRRKPTYRSRESTKVAEPVPGSAFTAAFAFAVDEINKRVWARGERVWNAEDEALGQRILCAKLRKMSSPFPELADRMDRMFPIRHAGSRTCS